MKPYIIILALLTIFVACSDKKEHCATFESFEYNGLPNGWYDREIDTTFNYYNPIISGFYPDPSICRKGDDYFLVNSSFSFYPGIPIFHSKDLVNWTQIGHVLDRPEQLDLDGLDISSGIFAPAISYNEHNQTYYVVSTLVGGKGNFVVKTQDPLKGWSDPIWLPQVIGIDPSLFFDNDGKAYIVHNGDPEGDPRWEGHRAIVMHEYDLIQDKTVGEPRIVVDGGVDKSQKPIWIEGPHIYRLNGSYLLLAAEGGTAEMHSAVVFKSDNVWGPYIPAKQNPILTQRDLPISRPNKITCSGHADIIDTPEGDWWAVFLACRPYEGEFFNTGRETFLLPVTWENDFPVILPPAMAIPKVVKKPLANYDVKQRSHTCFIDDFDSDTLSHQWAYIRTPRENYFHQQNGSLNIALAPVSIKDKVHPAFIGVRQQHIAFECETKLCFDPRSQNEKAGIVCFQKETHHITFLKELEEGKAVWKVVRVENTPEVVGRIEIPDKQRNKSAWMKVIANGARYSYMISYDKKDWTVVAADVNGYNLSTAKAGGFVGTFIGLYASGATEIVKSK